MQVKIRTQVTASTSISVTCKKFVFSCIFRSGWSISTSKEWQGVREVEQRLLRE